jgi:hypothetical protein
MSRPLRLHLDEDASSEVLHQALVRQGHNVSRTPTDWMPRSASDTEQLKGATDQERCIFTFNIRDFMALAQTTPNHYGIIVAPQSGWTLRELIATLNYVLSHIEVEDMIGQLRWLSDWKGKT